MYSEDSFFTLSLAGQAGLATLSGVLGLLTLIVGGRLFRTLQFSSGVLRLIANLAAAFGLLWCFVWLSPQIYYFYYQAIFTGLPWQIVIKTPPTPETIGEILFFRADWNMSNHSKAVLGWLLMLYAFAKSVKVGRND